MNKKLDLKSFLWLTIGIILSVLSCVAINPLKMAGSQILTMGSRGQYSAATMQYFFALIFLYTVLAAGVALIIVSVSKILRSLKK